MNARVERFWKQMERLERQAAEREAKKAAEREQRRIAKETTQGKHARHTTMNKVFGSFVVPSLPQKATPKRKPSVLQYLPQNVRNPYASKYVYLMVNREHGVYKIGYADDPEKRRKNIEGEIPLPFPIEIVQAWETYHFTKLESALHKHFVEKHFKGEWFKLSDADVADCFAFVEHWLEANPSIPVIAC